MDKRKVAIIGGSGFIGTRLVKRLNARSDLSLTIIDKQPSPQFPGLYHYGDVTEPQTLLKPLKGCDALINLAAAEQNGTHSSALHYQVNVQGARNLCMMASLLDIRQIIFTSSVDVYVPVKREIDEEGDILPLHHYGKSKLEAEYVYEAWRRADSGNKLAIIRPTEVFGEGHYDALYTLLYRIASGRLVMIGSGKNMKSMSYVENIAAKLEYELDLQPLYHISNYADKPDMTVNEWIAAISSSLGKNRKSMHIPYFLGICGAAALDVLSKISRKKFLINRSLVRDFCTRTQFKSSVSNGFVAPVDLNSAIERTIRYERVK
ncbi:NAD-dependent epimerase/dehydratase family protein [Serratia entomophila]|uniref:NAD-dependent epimerase/dehydratase family protein n=1 Tax=Serratia entomophila TaxID=42906 RepID=UPI002179286E|nr:NAD-dependent epimerase/dehydratase family protein [Serratia entomophila]CAI0756611.1 hopanoid-associated sugar epimerase [Serratia entomophila]CAI0756717.1 hopanoid-associated sugar epimerase [Serratia entomophila]CAI0758150.1 hopanoid-associated sugar epimerase [Serratia entomophila]CAI0822446.1 hopanoid-associated sugar epimerase [Serratia entomophila]CAI1596590.1 hopanoid-associated sugar epimerase [Serratia entomophila]